jgi:hypothetical protein
MKRQRLQIAAAKAHQEAKEAAEKAKKEVAEKAVQAVEFQAYINRGLAHQKQELFKKHNRQLKELNLIALLTAFGGFLATLDGLFGCLPVTFIGLLFLAGVGGGYTWLKTGSMRILKNSTDLRTKPQPTSLTEVWTTIDATSNAAFNRQTLCFECNGREEQ